MGCLCGCEKKENVLEVKDLPPKLCTVLVGRVMSVSTTSATISTWGLGDVKVGMNQDFARRFASKLGKEIRASWSVVYQTGEWNKISHFGETILKIEDLCTKCFGRGVKDIEEPKGTYFIIACLECKGTGYTDSIE